MGLFLLVLFGMEVVLSVWMARRQKKQSLVEQMRALRAFHKGDFSQLRYQEILAFAHGRGLALSGYSYEKGINETVIDQIEDYIVQIEIPIFGIV